MHPKGANSMAMFVLGSGKALFGTRRATSVLFGISGVNGLRIQLSHLVGPPFPAFKACFSATLSWHLPKALIEVVGEVTVTYLLKMAKMTSGSNVEPNSQGELMFKGTGGQQCMVF